ncbi:MAG: precorrin-6y C5,15-methyltransferase (decarboxylating) subunit CbiE [Chromatiaceae bacterium]|nr:precorrin-6y C5,15-methyltransferase (decarboxylating) subunit CbiE [Chromatiaceae bacterium]
MFDSCPPPPCRIIGVLDDGPPGLTAAAMAHLQAADLVIGGTRLLNLCAVHLAPQAERRDLTGCLGSVPAWIRAALVAGRRVVVLATGDPLFHGIAGYLRARLPDLPLEIIPNLSTLQVACARLGLAWQDLRIVSVHGQDCGEWREGAGPEHGLYPILRAIQYPEAGHGKGVSSIDLGPRPDSDPVMAILTSPANSPDRIARMLIQEGLGDRFRMTVAARLCRLDEQVIADCALDQAATMTFAEPNLVILTRQAPAPAPVLFGLADERFRQRQPDRGLITKREARALSLARLQLRADSIVWDIGAGSGAVGLEAARLCPLGFVHAIEKNPEDAAIARENRRRLGIPNYRLLQAQAPQGLADWPDPNAVFIGGSGGQLVTLIQLVLTRLRAGGWLVMNFVTFENLHLAMTELKTLQARWDVTQIQASRGQPILAMHRLVPENPVWILAATPVVRHDR